MAASRPVTSAARVADVRPRVLAQPDVTAAARVLASAFMVEPGNVVMYPDPRARLRVLEATGRVIVERARRHATAYGVDVDGELAALAVWDPPGVRPGLPPVGTLPTVLQRTAAIAAQLPAIVEPVRTHRRELIPLIRARQRAVRRASEGPSWHLGFLATHPEHQGRGLARALVDHVLRRCDDDALPAWLETTDPINPPIYERFGFTTVSHIHPAAWLPGLWVMRREPASDRRTPSTP